jgi:hypothetical protein
MACSSFADSANWGELGVRFGDEARHLFLEGFAVVFDFLGTDVAAGGGRAWGLWAKRCWGKKIA